MENWNNYTDNEKSNENSTKNSVSNDVKYYFSDAYKSLCKIKIENHKYGSGFLIKLERGIKPFYCLMTSSYQVITKNMIKNENTITVYYNNGYNRFNIKLVKNKNKRFKKDYSYINSDIFIIQILPEDKVDESFYLEPYYTKDFHELLNKNIYIITPGKSNNNILESKIDSIKLYEFTFLNNNTIFTGLPIFILINDKISIIGMHRCRQKNQIKNKADFIGPIIDSLKNNSVFHRKEYTNGLYIGEFKDNKREGYGKFIRKNQSYYIGQWLNDFEHGKGTIFSEIHSDKDYILYEGDFSNGKLNGNGRSIYENGNYYVGQFSNNLRHGKGTIFYQNNSIKYEGDFIKDLAEGNGKYIWEDGDYYIGQFFNNLRHGKGTEYYKNGKEKYIGDFIKNKYEGNGKYIWENGNYYIGQWLNGLKHGKGILYSKDNIIIYEGNFANDKKCI